MIPILFPVVVLNFALPETPDAARRFVCEQNEANRTKQKEADAAHAKSMRDLAALQKQAEQLINARTSLPARALSATAIYAARNGVKPASTRGGARW